MTAAVFNEWRVIPRLLMISYYTFFAWAFWSITSWYMAYDFNAITEPTVALAITGFPVGVLGVLSGVLLKLSEHYFKTGGTNGQGNGG